MAVFMTGCGDTNDDSSAAETVSSRAESKTESRAEEQPESSEDEPESVREKAESSTASESSKAKESSEAEESKAEESEPEETETVTQTPPEPEPIESEYVTYYGTGYSFEADMSRWMDAMDMVTVTETDVYGEDSPGVEHILGWLGDGMSSVAIAHYISDVDYSEFEISSLGEAIAAEIENIPDQQLTDWGIVTLNGDEEWIWCEYTLDQNAYGVRARGLQYECLTGYDMFIISATIVEEGDTDMESDLSELMESFTIG